MDKVARSYSEVLITFTIHKENVLNIESISVQLNVNISAAALNM